MIRRRGGFTLVEVVVALALMSIVMVMVTTTFLMLTNYTGKESGFFETITDLTTAQRRITDFVGANDRSGVRFVINKKREENKADETEEYSYICAFNSTGELVVGDFPFSDITVKFSRMEVYNTAYCELTHNFNDNSGLKIGFDALLWIKQAWAGKIEESIYNSIKDIHNYENYSISVGEDGCLYAEYASDKQCIYNPKDGVTVAVEGNNVTLRGSGIGINSYIFDAKMPLDLWKARISVLKWANEQSGMAGVRYGITDTVLTVTEGSSRRYLCFISGENAARYQLGFLMSAEDQKNLLLVSGSAPIEVQTLSELDFTGIEGLGVRCEISHYMRGAEQSYDFLCETRAAKAA